MSKSDCDQRKSRPARTSIKSDGKYSMCDRRVLISAVVTDIHDSLVTYPSCSGCYSKLLVDPTTLRYHCIRCGTACKENKVQWRYRLVLSLADSTSIGRVVVFGKTLDGFFGKTATDFTRSLADLERTGYPASSMLSEALLRTFNGKYFYFGFKVSFPSIYEEIPTLKQVLNTESSLCYSQLDCSSNFDNSHTLAYQMLPCSDGVYATVTDHMRLLVKSLRNQNQSIESRTPTSNQCKNCKLYPRNQSTLELQETGSVNVSGKSRLHSNSHLSSYKTMSFGEDVESVRFSFEDTCNQSSSLNVNNELISDSNQIVKSSNNEELVHVAEDMSELLLQCSFNTEPNLLSKEHFLSMSDIHSKELLNCVTFSTFNETTSTGFHTNETHDLEMANQKTEKCDLLHHPMSLNDNTFNHLSITARLEFGTLNESCLSNTSKRIDNELMRREISNFEDHVLFVDDEHLKSEAYKHNVHEFEQRQTVDLDKYTDDLNEIEPAVNEKEDEKKIIVTENSKQKYSSEVLNEFQMPDSEDLDAFFESQFEGITFTQDLTSSNIDRDCAKNRSPIHSKDIGGCDIQKEVRLSKENAKIDVPDIGALEVTSYESCQISEGKGVGKEKESLHNFLDLPESEELEDFLDSFDCFSENEQLLDINLEEECERKGTSADKYQSNHEKTSDQDTGNIDKLHGMEIGEKGNSNISPAKAYQAPDGNLLGVSGLHQPDAKTIHDDSYRVGVEKQFFLDKSDCSNLESERSFHKLHTDIEKGNSDKNESTKRIDMLTQLTKSQEFQLDDSDLQEFFHDLSKVSLDQEYSNNISCQQDKNLNQALSVLAVDDKVINEVERNCHKQADLIQNEEGNVIIDNTPDQQHLKSYKTMLKPIFTVLSICDTEPDKRQHTIHSNKINLDITLKDKTPDTSPNNVKQEVFSASKYSIAVEPNPLTKVLSKNDAMSITGASRNISTNYEQNLVDCSADLFETSDAEIVLNCDYILTVCTPSFDSEAFLENSKLDKNIVEDSPLGTSTPGLDNCVLLDSPNIEFHNSIVKDEDCKRKVKFDRRLRRVSSCHIIDIRMKRNESPLINMPSSTLKSCLKSTRGLFSNKVNECSRVTEESKYGDKTANDTENVNGTRRSLKPLVNVINNEPQLSAGTSLLDGSADLFGESMKNDPDEMIISSDMIVDNDQHSYPRIKQDGNDRNFEKHKDNSRGVSDQDDPDVWLDVSSDSLVNEAMGNVNNEVEDMCNNSRSSKPYSGNEVSCVENVFKPGTPEIFASQDDLFCSPPRNVKSSKGLPVKATGIFENQCSKQVDSKREHEVRKIRKCITRQALKLLVNNTPDCDGSDLDLKKETSFLKPSLSKAKNQSPEFGEKYRNEKALFDLKENISVLESPDIFGDSRDGLGTENDCDINNCVAKSNILCKKLFF